MAAWKTLPSYMIYGTADRNIPAAVMKFMAERAHARKTVAVEGASHVVMISHPAEVATLIEEAAQRRNEGAGCRRPGQRHAADLSTPSCRISVGSASQMRIRAPSEHGFSSCA